MFSPPQLFFNPTMWFLASSLRMFFSPPHTFLYFEFSIYLQDVSRSSSRASTLFIAALTFSSNHSRCSSRLSSPAKSSKVSSVRSPRSPFSTSWVQVTSSCITYSTSFVTSFVSVLISSFLSVCFWKSLLGSTNHVKQFISVVILGIIGGLVDIKWKLSKWPSNLGSRGFFRIFKQVNPSCIELNRLSPIVIKPVIYCRVPVCWRMVQPLTELFLHELRIKSLVLIIVGVLKYLSLGKSRCHFICFLDLAILCAHTENPE